MLILSRELGESVVIEDVVLTLMTVGGRYAEISLVKKSGGKSTLVTLPYRQFVDICYNVQVMFIAAIGTKARLGFEADDTNVNRGELLDP